MIGLQSNALKFTEHGKVETIVEIISNEEDEQYLKVSVLDTGIGIKKENYDKLFKLFGFVQDQK
jgi:signal transduction histidine kinase